MVSIVFLIATLNLILGFVLAVRLERPLVLYVPDLSRVGRAAPPDIPSPEDELSLIPPRDLVIEQIPQRWVEMLSEADLEVNSFVEASVQILKLEVDLYRADVMDSEEIVRRGLDKENKEAVQDAVNELAALNDEWMAKQCEAVRMLTERRGNLDGYESTADRLENVLLDQVPLLETYNANAKGVDLHSGESAGQALLHEIGQLIGLAHELRDAMQDALLAIMRNEDRLDGFERRQQFDSLTGLHNRLGIELVFRNWWREDVARMRLVSVAMLDIDRFADTNLLLGTRVGDRVLGTVGRYLDELITKDSGLDRVFHPGGQRFLLFFGDTGPRSAVKSVETIRQTIEATKFETAGEEFALTVSAGVAEVQQHEGTPELFERLASLTDGAKKAGRNRVCVDEGEGAEVVQPASIQVKGRVITIE